MTLTLFPRAMETLTEPSSVDEASGGERRFPPEAGDSVGGLTVVQVREGEGRFLLRAVLTSQETARATVDLSRDALGLRVGSVVRWVAIPQDALVNEATVQISDGLLTVSMPLRVERKVRHVLHVW
jgi:hypothetical protein